MGVAAYLKYSTGQQGFWTSCFWSVVYLLLSIWDSWVCVAVAGERSGNIILDKDLFLLLTVTVAKYMTEDMYLCVIWMTVSYCHGGNKDRQLTWMIPGLRPLCGWVTNGRSEPDNLLQFIHVDCCSLAPSLFGRLLTNWQLLRPDTVHIMVL